MADLTFNKVTDIKRIPIRAAVFYGSGIGGFLHLFYLEKGSYYQTKKITKNHYQGGKIQTGFILSVNLIIPQNMYATNGLIDKLETLISKTEMGERIDLQMICGTQLAPGMGSNYQPPTINADHDLWVDFSTLLTYTYDVEHKETRPRIILEGEGFAYKLNNLRNVTTGTPEVLFN